MTVLEAIQKSAEFLARKGVDSPRLQAELLLAHLLKIPRLNLYLNHERALTAAELDSFRELIKRRGRREPLQHIVGTVSFCGVELAINRHALVPRPETEILAEQGWEFLNQRSKVDPQSASALDLGTGSGCLAIVLAVKCPAAEIWATDVSADALELAKQNAAKHGLDRQMHFMLGDLFCALPSAKRFDLIITNPPYVASTELDLLAPEVREYEPRLSLNGGADGLDCIRRIADEARAFLKPDGRIMLEFGDGQAATVQEIFQRQKWIVEALKEDYTQRPRILIARAGWV